jgi:hypothetical protein
MGAKVSTLHTSCYRLKAALPLLAFGDNHDDALPIPAGSIIDVLQLPEDDRFVLVRTRGQEFHAFASDIANCCELLPRRAA